MNHIPKQPKQPKMSHTPSMNHTLKKQIIENVYNERKSIIKGILEQLHFADVPNLTNLIMSNIKNDKIVIKYGTQINNIHDLISSDGYLIADIQYKICDQIVTVETGTRISKIIIKQEEGEIYLKNGVSGRYFTIPMH